MSADVRIPHPSQPTPAGWCAECLAVPTDPVFMEHHATPTDESANHPNHDGLRAMHLDYWTCSHCLADAHWKAHEAGDFGSDDTHELDTSYNGWTNRETWVTNLWLSNDEPTYRGTVATVESGGTVEAYAREIIRSGAAGGMIADLTHTGSVSDALGRVNWPEIEEAWSEYRPGDGIEGPDGVTEADEPPIHALNGRDLDHYAGGKPNECPRCATRSNLRAPLPDTRYACWVEYAAVTGEWSPRYSCAARGPIHAVRRIRRAFPETRRMHLRAITVEPGAILYAGTDR